jgi:hypothetical protein
MGPLQEQYMCMAVLNIILFSVPSSHNSVIGMSIVFSLFWKFHCSPCHPLTI